ncbi:hypothetical protein ACXYTP_25385 [Tsukamurella ocularis]
MASDPADLIREADAALDGITPGPWEASGFDNMPHDVVQMEDDEHGTPWAVDQVAGQVKPRDAEFIAAAPDLVRRLRDALEATAGDACGTCLAIAREARKDASLFENLYDEARAALAEANATIQRVRALAEQYDDQCGSCGSISGGRSIAEDIRRAIEGPS